MIGLLVTGDAMAGSSRIECMIRERTARRRETALACVAKIMAETKQEGVDIAVIGSMVTGRFRAHSDVDLLVRSDVDSAHRVRVERIVANAMRRTGIPYDLIFATDLSAEQLKEFELDLIEASSVR